MNRLFLTDKEIKDNLYPFTLTRSAADIRVGILTIREKWQTYTGDMISIADDDVEYAADTMILSANIIPSKEFIESLTSEKEPSWKSVKIIQYPWHIFQWNDWALREDFKLITQGRKSQQIPSSVQTTGKENIFIEEGAKVTHCIINASTGPVYIGKNAEVMEGVMIRGPVAICEGAVLKMGAKIYGATTIGPYCIAGGEIKNSVLIGNSNKSHDGYLGDSVIGEWCNLGAGTTNSNMKNNVSEVKMWNESQKQMIGTGISKCGLIMGDYSRAAINTSFNTGTTVGVCANIFGQDLPHKFIPSFAWGSSASSKYEFNKALDDIDKWKKLKGKTLTENDKKILKLIFEAN
jgi:UDP-N-acetylglucosamine diphosphorylase/glucosamine-1-phosphate N-acetyltransferase